MNLFHEAKKVLDKDGKVNALGPYGKSKLTGREVSQYFRKNKVSDPQVKKAVEVALDLGGAYDVARKEIEKFYGSKILKSKEVQQALKFANEEVVSENFDKDPDIKKISMATNLFAKDELVKLKDFIAKNKLDKKKIVKDLDKKKNQLQHIRDVILNPSKKSGLAPKIIQNYKEEVVTEGKLGDSIIRKDFPNVWAASARDRNILKKFHAKVDTSNYKQQKDLYRKDIKGFIDSLNEGTMAIGIFDSNPSEKRKAIAGMQKLLKGKQNVKVGSPEGQKIGDQLDMKYLSDDELADDFARSSNKNMTISQLLKKHEKRLGLNFKEEVEEAVSPAQQAAIAIAKKEKEKKESVMDAYRKMHEVNIRGKLDTKYFSYAELQYMNITDKLMKKHDLMWASGSKNTIVALKGRRGATDIGISGHPNDIKAFKADLQKALKKMKSKQ